MRRERSAVWRRALVSCRAPSPDGVPRPSASFVHMGPEVLASLNFPAEIHVLTLPPGCCFQKQYSHTAQHWTLYRNVLGQHWPTQIKPAWWSFSLSCRTQSFPAQRALELGVSFKVFASSKGKNKWKQDASKLPDLYPKCVVVYQTARYFCSARVLDPDGKRTKYLGLPRPKHGANRQNARNHGK